MEPATKPASVALFAVAVALALLTGPSAAGDNNHIYQPCLDAKIQRKDGFTFGIAFSSKDSFFSGGTQLSPCDRRLSLANSARVAVFRPKVDEISLLSVNSTASTFSGVGGWMVAFAGRKFAARSPPFFVANGTFIVTSFTLVLEFKKGTLQNLYWKRDGCASCSQKSSPFTCINGQECAIRTTSCKDQGQGQSGKVDCSLGIQVAFSGTDKHLAVLNSWYEVSKLKQYSLYGVYGNLKNSLTSEFNKFF